MENGGKPLLEDEVGLRGVEGRPEHWPADFARIQLGGPADARLNSKPFYREGVYPLK